MTDVLGTWAVQYDGREWLHQNDATRSEFDPSGGEVPFRAINWSRVTAVRFENEHVQSEFDILPPPDGYTLSMRRRTFITHIDGEQLETVTTIAYLICRHPIGINTEDEAAMAAAVDEVTYWFPTGVVYQTQEFNAGPAGEYAMRLARCAVLGEPVPSLPAASAAQRAAISAVLEEPTP